MEESFEKKYIVLKFFLQFIAIGSTMITQSGNSLSLQTQKISEAQQTIAQHWPKGIVTYYMDNLAYDQFIDERVRKSMNILEDASCVRFKPTPVKPTENVTWIHFTNPQRERNCVHEPKFKKDGEIIVVLGFDCLKEHEILHSIFHAIGFHDEVTHPHRNQYIRVLWDNLKPEYRNLYRIRSGDEVSSTLLVEYDPLSVMHFHDRAFSMNGHATLMPLVPGLLINPSEDLSQLDKMRLRLLFDRECNKRKVGDIIDTCKMFLTNNIRPDYSKNETDPTSEEKSVSDEKGESEGKEESAVEDKTDDIQEVEVKNGVVLKSVENHYDLNELITDNEIMEQQTNNAVYQENKSTDVSDNVTDNEGEKLTETDGRK